MSEGSRFSLVDVTVLSAIAFVVLVFVFITLSQRNHHHGGHRQMQSNTQIRGIHQSMVMYAHSNGNWFPGFDQYGEIIDASVEYRYQVLLEGNYFTGEYMLSPSETKTDSGDWRGSLAWGDNHTAFSTTHLVDTLYGEGTSNTDDNLFDDATGDDAYMIYTGD